jgi:hypothetical protein
MLVQKHINGNMKSHRCMLSAVCSLPQAAAAAVEAAQLYSAMAIESVSYARPLHQLSLQCNATWHVRVHTARLLLSLHCTCNGPTLYKLAEFAHGRASGLRPADDTLRCDRLCKCKHHRWQRSHQITFECDLKLSYTSTAASVAAIAHSHTHPHPADALVIDSQMHPASATPACANYTGTQAQESTRCIAHCRLPFAVTASGFFAALRKVYCQPGKQVGCHCCILTTLDSLRGCKLYLQTSGHQEAAPSMQLSTTVSSTQFATKIRLQ